MTRIQRLRELLIDAGLDAALLSLGHDLPYFTGYHAMPLERLTMAVIPAEGTATLVVPQLEAPRVLARPEFEIRPWAEIEDPTAIVASLLPDGPASLALGDQTWAVFLLRLQEILPKARFVSATPFTRTLRMRKEPGEIECLRAAAHAADEVAARLTAMRWDGRTEREIASDLARALRESGHERVDFTIVASGPNGASPHHEASDRVVSRGDVVVCDFGGTRLDYCSDITRCVTVGPPPAEVREMWELLRRAQEAAFEAVRPGVAAQDVDRAARAVIAAAGYGDYFVHRTGHGIGLETHEHPYIVEGNELVLEAGMTFSVEPGIYIPGRFGIRLEDIVAVTPDGGVRLNEARRDLVEVI